MMFLCSHVYESTLIDIRDGSVRNTDREQNEDGHPDPPFLQFEYHRPSPHQRSFKYGATGCKIWQPTTVNILGEYTVHAENIPVFELSRLAAFVSSASIQS